MANNFPRAFSKDVDSVMLDHLNNRHAKRKSNGAEDDDFSRSCKRDNFR